MGPGVRKKGLRRVAEALAGFAPLSPSDLARMTDPEGDGGGLFERQRGAGLAARTLSVSHGASIGSRRLAGDGGTG